MKDADRDTGQLITELEKLRQRIKQLESAKAESENATSRLIDSEIRYRRLFETAQDGILILEAKTGQVTDVNPFLEKMLGYSHEEFVGKKLWEIGPFKDVKASKFVFAELQEKGYVRYEHLPLQAKDGSEIAVEFVSNVYKIDHTSVIQCNIRDITERKELEKRFQKERQEFELIVESSPIMIFHKDKDGRFVRVNKAMAKQLAKPKEEILDKTVFDLFSAGIAQPMTDDDQKVTKSGRPELNIIEKYESAAGIRWVRTDKVPIFDGNGVMSGLIGFAQDITEWKNTEQFLSESEAKYRELAEGITDVFFAMDNKLRYTYWNRASEELTGIPAKEALGKQMSDIFPDDEASIRAESVYRSVLATKEPQHFVNEYSLGGRDYVFDISAYPTNDGLCVYVKDITERRKLEQALAESEQWYRHLFDNAPFGIGFASIDGKVINLNKAMEVITGYSAEEFTNINLADTYVNKADREALLQEIRRHGSAVDYPMQLRRKDGTTYDAVVTSRLTNIGDREFVQTILNDVTERKRAEKSLKESEERYRSLIELSPEAIFVAAEGKHVFINSAGLELFGASSPDEIIGKPVMDVIHPDYREIVAERMRKAMETGITPPPLEEKFIRFDGTEVDVEVRAAPLVYEGKLAMQAVVRDISERRRAEESLRLSERNFRDSIENSPLGIRIVSEDGKTLYVNRALLDIYGYSSFEELEAVPRGKRYTPESYKEHDERVKKRKRGECVPSNYQISIVRKDSQVRDLSVSRGEVLWNGKKQFQVVYQDITERKQAEEEYQTIIRTAMDGFMLTDMQEHLLDVNDSYCNLIGYSRDELLNMSIVDIEAMMTQDEITRHFREFEKVGHDRFESRHRRKDGGIMDVEVSVNYLPIKGGRLFVFLRDITERKLVEAEMRMKDYAMASSISGILILGLDGTVLYVNQAYLDMWAYQSAEQAIGRKLTEIAVDNELTRMLLTTVNTKGEWKGELNAPLRDGRTLDVLLSAGLVRDDKNVPVYIMASVVDIAERKRAEESLRASEARYRLLAENVRDVIWSTDMDLRFTYVSPSAKYIVDYTAEEIMSMSFEQLLMPSSLERALSIFAEELALAKVMPPDPGRSRTLEIEFIRSDGSLLWAELKMSFIREPDGRPIGILGVMRDIAERKKAEEERREMEQKAQLASRLASVGELAAGIAHEINNPLTGVIGYAELLMYEDVPEHIKNDLKIIYEGGKRVADVVRGLLTFASQTRPEHTVVDVNQVIEIVLRLRAYELETGNIKVTARLAPDIPVTVADAGQLQQVFLNLIINAEMEMRSAHGKGKLIIKTERIDNTIRVSFKDDGPGIAEENLERIFDPFFTTKEVGEGTGLGLSICHGIVNEHGGRIWAESHVGKGATFVVELPVVTERKRPRQAKPARKAEKTAKGKILVVDDEPVVRQLLSQVLTEEGHEVETTDSGKDTLKQIKSNNYNLILLDMKLPEMSGSELYERIKEIEPSMAKRVVFITGDVMGMDTEAILARTGVPCITKPFDVNKLGAEINRLLTRHRHKRTHQVKSQKPKVRR